ncbi:MAG TPA: Rrf2 family transcriptional regulator [Planctomycetota bacterium]|nr:Rrf2 family transcriptional regulator [Planctomycetota bacterium]
MFSQASEYALRALTVLGACEQGQWVLAHDLADLLNIKVHYLAKVLQILARRGILESQRGRQGGFRLARKPESITLWDVVAELDDVSKLEGCVMGEDQCSDETACPLHTLWKDLRTKFKEKLQNTSLKQLAEFPRDEQVSCSCPDRNEPGHAATCREHKAGNDVRIDSPV